MTRKKRDRFRKGSAEWIRLGELLTERRGTLDVSYEGHGGRAAFARERGVNLKLVQDIELDARENFTALTLRDQIAPAYEVTYESIRAVLAGTGDLVPAGEDAGHPAAAPGTAPLYPAAVAEEAAPPPAGNGRALPGPGHLDDGWLPPLPLAELAAARPHADQVWLLVAQAAFRLRKEPELLSGEDLFGAGSREAWTWDLLPGRPVPRKVWLVADARAAAGARRASGAG